MDKPKTWAEMFAEGMREIGVLTFVFGLLDKFIDGVPTPRWTGVVIGLAVAFFLGGCILERRRV